MPTPPLSTWHVASVFLDIACLPSFPALSRRAHALAGSKRSLCKSGRGYPPRAVWDRAHLSTCPCPVLSTISAGASWCSSNELTFKITKATVKEINLLTGLAVFPALSLVICIQLEERVLPSHLFLAAQRESSPVCSSAASSLALTQRSLPAAAPEPARTGWQLKGMMSPNGQGFFATDNILADVLQTCSQLSHYSIFILHLPFTVPPFQLEKRLLFAKDCVQNWRRALPKLF